MAEAPPARNPMVVAIVAEEHPDRKLTPVDGKKILDDLIEALILAENKESIQFTSALYMTGFVRIKCQNEDSKKWIYDQFSDSSTLKVLPYDDMPRSVRATAWLKAPNVEHVDKMLELLKKQNGLATEEWRVRAVKKLSSKEYQLSLDIDAGSQAKLLELKCRPAYALGTAKFKIHEVGKMVRKSRRSRAPEETGVAFIGVANFLEL